MILLKNKKNLLLIYLILNFNLNINSKIKNISKYIKFSKIKNFKKNYLTTGSIILPSYIFIIILCGFKIKNIEGKIKEYNFGTSNVSKKNESENKKQNIGKYSKLLSEFKFKEPNIIIDEDNNKIDLTANYEKLKNEINEMKNKNNCKYEILHLIDFI